MYPVGVYIIASVLSIWLGILTYLFWKKWKYITTLFPEIKEKDSQISFLNKFQEVLNEIEELTKRTQLLTKNVKEVSIEGLNHAQRISLLRYNPYGDTGGEQSFTAVVLDGKGNGILITSLHTRAGTRIYAKNINEGVCDLQLSEEEQKALQQALEK